MVTISSTAQKARNASTAGPSGTSFNRESGEDGYSDSMPSTEDRVCSEKPLCHKCGQREELLCLWRIWAHSLAL